MYGIEEWPSRLDNEWQGKMNEARQAAIQGGLLLELVKTAASMGILKLVRTADKFGDEMLQKIRVFMDEHEMAVSEVVGEIHHRIATVRVAFVLTEEHVSRAVNAGLARYIDDGGSPEFAIKLADLTRIPEEERNFLQINTGL